MRRTYPGHDGQAVEAAQDAQPGPAPSAPSPLPRAGSGQDAGQDARAINARAQAGLDFRRNVLAFVAEIVDSLDDLAEVDLKLEGIHEQGQFLHDRLYAIRSEFAEDDREASVPTVDLSWVR